MGEAIVAGRLGDKGMAAKRKEGGSDIPAGWLMKPGECDKQTMVARRRTLQANVVVLTLTFHTLDLACDDYGVFFL